jgi:hypothetical protein
MKKLVLKLDDLHVESFDTTSNRTAARGTVEGREDPDLPGKYETFSCFSCNGTCLLSDCFGHTCGFSCDTCNGSCFGTCDASCDSCDFSCNGTCGEGTCYAETCICYP